MSTSGTAVFFPSIVEMVEEAYEQAGLEMRSGYDLRTARRSLNLLSLEWANRGVNLWVIDQQAIPLIQGLDTYALPLDTIDVIEMVLRTPSGNTYNDISIQRMSVETYATIPNKSNQGRPVQVWINRQEAPSMVVWPIPNMNNQYTLVYWRLRRIQDTGVNGELTMDIPQRFLPPMIAGLAYKLALKSPDAASRLPALKQEYESLWMDASTEDREKTPLRLVPYRSYT